MLHIYQILKNFNINDDILKHLLLWIKILSPGQSQEELDEEEEERKRMEAEAEIQRVKARQAFLDNLAVMVAMTSIVILAVVIVILKSVMFPDDKIITFIPLPQQVCLQYRAYESPQFEIACRL
jgi:hypothetical protein